MTDFDPWSRDPRCNLYRKHVTNDVELNLEIRHIGEYEEDQNSIGNGDISEQTGHVASSCVVGSSYHAPDKIGNFLR